MGFMAFRHSSDTLAQSQELSSGDLKRSRWVGEAVLEMSGAFTKLLAEAPSGAAATRAEGNRVRGVRTVGQMDLRTHWVRRRAFVVRA